MIIFEHQSSDKIILGEKATVEVTIYEKMVDDTYVVNIPSLNIHVNTRKKEEIGDLIHTTLTSFFRFWKKIQGDQKFYDHMMALGFTIRTDENHQAFQAKNTGKKIKDELELA